MVTNRGRIDAVVEVASAIYIFEFKLNGSTEDALAQIKTTAFYERYQRQGKALQLVRVNFSTRRRGVAKWVAGAGDDARHGDAGMPATYGSEPR